ncbi:glycosyltransferase [Pseudoruegeria sp. HB172150]|uniref:capsular polysaccharide export protein, LipB/KpsS family n=1 Tax=Pseudoruegeria sp. HB172150 TaxID=2721164 RepID=UPI001552BACF|nr:glycosyltransferase [Pseudoruegeria sp. HB172150]
MLESHDSSSIPGKRDAQTVLGRNAGLGLRTILEAEDPDRMAKITPDEITLVICLRLHDDNPWVLNRLNDLGNYYTPTPRILIFDYGSRNPHKTRVEDACKTHGFRYANTEDSGIYNAAAAHNMAASFVETPFIFFMDIDFVSVRSLFADLADAACAADMRRVFDVILDLPAYHLSERMTESLEATADHEDQEQFLKRTFFSGFFGEFEDEFEFVAPYSNCFLISKRFFELTGGYNEEFRGHGSEDVEFFFRAGLISGLFPVPHSSESDLYGPMTDEFFTAKPYLGFRRMNELMGMRAQRLGLKVFHRWHPIALKGTDWRSKNDWKRKRLKQAFDQYAYKAEQVLNVDFLERKMTAACICVASEHWGYFINLRLEGYRLVPFFENSEASAARLKGMIESGGIDALAVFNPYMKSHSVFRPAFEFAKEAGLETIVIERGALPDTVYYSRDVAYAGYDFAPETLENISVTSQEMRAARQYIEELRTGAHLLEDASSRSETEVRLSGKLSAGRQTIFVPLQLEDDMAVTHYVDPFLDYGEFVNSLPRVAAEHPDKLFLVKPHPLSKLEPSSLPGNVLLASRSDNVHAILDLCDAVVCYNSGVGLLAACHGKPLVTVGNAFYNLPGIGHRASDFAGAVDRVLSDPTPPSTPGTEELIAKFLFHRYSFFTATDVIQEFETKKAHGYEDIRVSRAIIRGTRHGEIWEKAVRRFSWKSFGASELNTDMARQTPQTRSMADQKIRRNPAFWVYATLYSVALTRAERKRLFDTPTRFFARGRHPISQFGRALFG